MSSRSMGRAKRKWERVLMRPRSTCRRARGREPKKTMGQLRITYFCSREMVSGQGEAGQREEGRQWQLLHNNTERLSLGVLAVSHRELM